MNSKKPRKRRDRGAPAAARDAEAHAPEDGELPVSRGLRGALSQWLKVLSGVLFVGAVSTALAFGLHHYARTTPRFAITNLEVEGIRRLSREDVLATAGVHLGENVFGFDTVLAEGKLSQSPWVQSARVRRKLPSTIEITLREHQPAALLVVLGKTFLVSEEGAPIKEVSSGDPHDLPVITGLSADELRRDRRAEVARIKAALDLLDHYAELPLDKNYPAEEVHLEDDGGAVLVVGAAGLSLSLGSPPWTASLHRAVRIVAKAAEQGGTPGVVFLDSEAHPERAVVRLR
jgi:cell division protein FtsQ